MSMCISSALTEILPRNRKRGACTEILRDLVQRSCQEISYRDLANRVPQQATVWNIAHDHMATPNADPHKMVLLATGRVFPESRRKTEQGIFDDCRYSEKMVLLLSSYLDTPLASVRTSLSSCSNSCIFSCTLFGASCRDNFKIPSCSLKS